MVLRRVRLYARRRITWLRKVWADVGQQNKHGVHSEVDGYLYNVDNPQAEFAWYNDTPELLELNREIAALNAALSEETDTRLVQLRQKLQLRQDETDLLHVCLALALDPGLSRVYAYLQDHSARAYVSESLTARLFGYGYFLPPGSTASSKIWALFKTQPSNAGDPIRYELDPAIRNWLLGQSEPAESLLGIVQQLPPKPALSNWPLDEVLAWIKRMSVVSSTNSLRIFIAGAEGSGRRSFAAVIARKLKLHPVAIDGDRIETSHWDTLCLEAQRHALLNDQALIWFGQEVHTRKWINHLPAYPMQFICGEVDEYLQPAQGFFDLRIELPPLSREIRRNLWVDLVPAAANWSVESLDRLVNRRQTTVGQINAVAVAGAESPTQAARLINTASRQRLGHLAQHLANDFRKADLVLPDHLRENLDHFLFEASDRVAFWENPKTRRLFPQGQGLLALFTGLPGTGKTMAAQVLANELQLDLYRIDLSAMVSKYVGETSKNIERILSRAQRMDAILLFDEADALFGKRTEIKDAHDRFANTDTNYLLQAIEQYPGLAILASNQKSNIDAGFIRRLRYVLDFPKPDKQQRQLIWQGIISNLNGHVVAEALKKDLKMLAQRFEITGAQIKYALLSATYLARQEQSRLSLKHLLQGLERELLKDGKGLGTTIEEILKKQT